MRTFAALFLAAAALAFAQSPAPVAPPAAAPPAAAPLTTDPAANARPPLPVPLQPNLPAVFLVGDSTVRNGKGQGDGGQWGWGEPFVHYFDLARVNVVNRALGGRSSRTYIAEGRWEETLALVKPGDVILVQFGHNDSGPLDDTARARGTLPGTGDETREIDNPITRRHETVHTYGWYLRQYVRDARRRKATPILCSLVPRKIWIGDRIQRNADTYAGWARQVALEEKVPFLDLNALIASRYDALGPEKVEKLFADPHTHTSLSGAELNAEVVISALKALADNPVAPYFDAKALAVPAANATGNY